MEVAYKFPLFVKLYGNFTAVGIHKGAVYFDIGFFYPARFA